MKKDLTCLILLMTVSLAVCWFAMPYVARAHSELLESSPAAGERRTLDNLPREVSLRFSQPLAPGSTISVVSWSTFAEVQQGQTILDADDPRVASVALPELESGRYSVNWYAVGEDEHTLEGSFDFEIITSSGASQASEMATTVATPPNETDANPLLPTAPIRPTSTETGSAARMIGPFLVLLVAAGFALLIRRRGS
jgi:copper resistance protein C